MFTFVNMEYDPLLTFPGCAEPPKPRKARGSSVNFLAHSGRGKDCKRHGWVRGSAVTMAPDRNRTRTRTRPRSFLLGWRSKLRSAGDEALRARLRSVLSLRDALADISQQHLTSLCLAFAHSGRGKDCKRHGCAEAPSRCPPRS